MSLRKYFNSLLLVAACSAPMSCYQVHAEDSDAVVRLSPRPEIRLANSSTRIARYQDPTINEPQTAVPPPAPMAEVSDGALGQSESLAPLQSRELVNAVQTVNLSLDGIGTGSIPDSTPEWLSDSPVGLPDGMSRGAIYQCVHWQSSNICHFPLYFEEAMLERHGHVRWGRLQPWASGVRFFTTISLLPYLKTLQPTYQTRYVLGQYRAGSCAPALHDTVPWDRNAAAVETLSLAGFFWATPL